MKTPVEVFLEVAASGGKLDIAGDRLRMLLPPDCPPELKNAIREHKRGLLELLRLNFLIVRSDTLNRTVVWSPEEKTKNALVAAGVSPGCIYTASELELLVRQGITPEDLLLLDAAKRKFHGRLADL